MAGEPTTSIQILVVDDDPEVCSVLRRGLEAEGYVVSEAGNVTQLMQRLEQAPPVSVITLDLELGNEDGLLLARKIRASRNVPIIMITGRDQPLDRLIGLEHGADDYIVKPFMIREVLLRVYRVLRLYELEGNSTEAPGGTDVVDERFAFDTGILDALQCEVTVTDGTTIALTTAERDILVLFLRNPARVLSRDELAIKLTGREWSPTSRLIDGHIARLRKKIEPSLEKPTLIKTVWRVGYTFAGNVTRLP